MQRTAIINGATVTYDKDYSLPAVAIMTPGVVEGLEVTTNSVAPGKAFIQVERTAISPSEIFYIIFENTTAVTIDTSGTKKVFIKIPKANLNDPGYNTASGEGIATIQTDADYPTEDYIPLASITDGVITDERENIRIKQSVEENGILLPKCTVQTETENYTFTGSEKNNTGFSTSTAGGNVTYTLDPSLFDLTKGLYEFTFCKSTGDTNTVTIDAGSGNTIDGEQTYTLNAQWETATMKIVNSNFIKVVATTNKSISFTQNQVFGKSAVLGNNLSFGQAIRLINDGGTLKIKNLYESLSRSIGSGVAFSTNNPTERIGVAKMSKDKFIVAYRKGTTSYAKIGVVNGTTITYTGNKVSWMPSFSEGLHYNQIAEIDTDKFAVSIMTGSLYPAIVVGTVSGSTITVGNTTNVSANSNFRGYENKIIKVGANKFVWFWRAKNGANYAVVGTVSGTSCTFGAIQTVQASGGNLHLSGCKIADDKVLLVYRKASDTYGYYRICTISGTALTLGTETVFNSGDTQNIDAVQVLNDKCIIAYTDVSNAGIGTLIELSISGTTGTLGSEFSFATTNTGTKFINFLSNIGNTYNFGISYIDVTDTSKLKYQRVSLNSGTFTNGTIGTINNVSSTDTGSACIGLDKIVFVYKDTANSNSGVAKAILDDRIETGYYRKKVAGIMQEDGIIGDTKTYIPIGGVSGFPETLTIGENYYIQEDGTIGTTVTNIPIGKAISTTLLNTGNDFIGLSGELSTTATTGSVTLGNAVGYFTANLNGTDIKIPYYNI